MGVKQGFIGSYDLGYLAGHSDVMRKWQRMLDQPSPDFEGVFYASVFQSGLERFLVRSGHLEEVTKSDFVRARVGCVSDSMYGRRTGPVVRAFHEHLPSGWAFDQKYAEVFGLESFLMDLLAAMHSKCSLLLVRDIPDIAKVERLLPSELLVPTSNLLASVEHEVVGVPGTQTIVGHEHIKRYQEILASDVFSKYSEAHEHLEHTDDTLSSSLANVVSSGRKLFANSHRALVVRNVAIGFLNITPQVIEVVFGRLPGALAETAAKLGVEFLNERRRVVVYSYRSFLTSVDRVHLDRALRTADPSKLAEYLKGVSEQTEE